MMHFRYFNIMFSGVGPGVPSGPKTHSISLDCTHCQQSDEDFQVERRASITIHQGKVVIHKSLLLCRTFQCLLQEFSGTSHTLKWSTLGSLIFDGIRVGRVGRDKKASPGIQLGSELNLLPTVFQYLAHLRVHFGPALKRHWGSRG